MKVEYWLHFPTANSFDEILCNHELSVELSSLLLVLT